MAGYNEFAAAPRPWSHTTKRVAGGGDAAVAGVARRSSLGREAGGRGMGLGMDLGREGLGGWCW